MSRENVELVIRALSALAERSRPDFETVNELSHPDHVLLSIASGRLGEAERKGARGFQAWLEEQERVMPFQMEVEGAVDVSTDPSTRGLRRLQPRRLDAQAPGVSPPARRVRSLETRSGPAA